MSTEKARRIASLLHLTRNASFSSDQALELSAALHGAKMEEIAWGTIEFCTGLLSASRQVLRVRRDAAVVDQVFAERDGAGGLMQ